MKVFSLFVKTPYEFFIKNLNGESKGWFKKTFRKKMRGIGVTVRDEAKNWVNKEYYIARMVRFMVEPYDNMPVTAELFSSAWSEDEKKQLDKAVNDIAGVFFDYLKVSNPDLFEEIAERTIYVCGLYGVYGVSL